MGSNPTSRTKLTIKQRLFVPFGLLSLPTMAHGDYAKVIRIYFPDPLSVRGESALVFSRRVRYRLIQDFLIPVESPSDKRGNLCSQNRLLGIEIWADYQLILADRPEIPGLYPCSWVSDLLAGSAKVGYM